MEPMVFRSLGQSSKNFTTTVRALALLPVHHQPCLVTLLRAHFANSG